MGVFYLDVSSSQTETEWTQITELDGREYVFRFFWNDRAHALYVDVADQDGVPIFDGAKLVMGVALGRWLVGDDRTWPGKLQCKTLSQDWSDPDRFDFGLRVQLVYDDLQPTVT